MQCPDLRPYQFTKPEKIQDVELGMKMRWQAGKARGLLDVAVYKSKLTNSAQNVQLIPLGVPNTAPDYPGGGITVMNVADIDVQGIEVAATVSPVSAVVLSVNGAYVDQKVKRLNIPAFGNVGAGGVVFDKNSVTLPSPEFSGTISARWTLPVQFLDGNLVLSGDYYHTSSYQAQQGFSLPGYDVGNAQLDWKNISGRGLDVGVWVKNITDKLYDQGTGVILPFFPVNTHFFAPPRTFGVDLRYQWGR